MKRKTNLIFMLLLSIFLLSSIKVNAAPALSNGNYYIYSVINDNFAIDLRGNSITNNTNIQLYKSNLSKAQLWKITQLSNGYYKISTISNNNYVLDVKGAKKKKGTNVQLYRSNNSPAQQWYIKSAGKDTYTLISKCNGLALDVKNSKAQNGQNIQVYTSKNNKAQKFYIVPEVTLKNNYKIDNGNYLIKSVLKDDYVIRLKKPETKNKNNIIMSDYNYSINEYWNIEQLPNKYYKISTARNNNYSLDLASGSKKYGSNIQLYKYTNNPNQQFIIIKNNDNTYSFINRTNGLALDIYNQNTSTGTNLQTYKSNYSKAQKFKLIKEVDTYSNDSKEVSLNNIQTDATKLMVVAHPDDETLWGSHGLYKDKYLVVCVTCGSRLDRVYEYKGIMSKTQDDYMMLGFPDLENGQKSDWQNVKNRIISTLTEIIDSKDWEEIVTYNPDGVTGHIHHKMTSEYITDIVTNNNEEDKLLYFGRYYFSGDIPEEDKKYYLNNDEYNFKTNILYPIYETQKNVLDYYNRMTRYETWISYNEWYNE